jgi:hypothetical protein
MSIGMEDKRQGHETLKKINAQSLLKLRLLQVDVATI